MRTFILKVLFFAMVITTTQTTCFAVDYDLGQIIETSANSNYIEVKDKIFKVNAVELLAVDGKPATGTLLDLKEGDLVKVIHGSKEIDYWNATLVIVYQGEMEELIREKLELPVRAAVNETKNVSKANKPNRDTPIKFEDGVWQN